MISPFHRPHRVLKYLPFLLLFAFLAGCGRSLPPTASVSGKVTWNGKPVECGTITFYPEKGRPATGSIQPDGSYRLTTFSNGDGAELGKHRVTIQATRVSGGAAPKSFADEIKSVGKQEKSATVVWLVPEEYSRQDTSPLTAEVAAGSNVINFELPEKAGGAKR